MGLQHWFQRMSNFFNKTNKIIDDTTYLEIASIEKYFNNSHLINFIQNYEQLLQSKGSAQCFTTFGINFKNGTVDSVKFYAHIFEELTEDEILLFVPTIADYNRYIHVKDKGTASSPKSLGTVLELKFKRPFDKPIFGFFYLLQNTEESYKAIGYPKRLPQEIINQGVSLGVNYEYNEDKITFKRYYYYSGLVEKKHFEKKMGIPLLGNFIEYAEGDSISKVNTYSGILNDFWKKDRNFNNKERIIIKYLSDKYNLSIMCYGKYDNNTVRAIYYRASNSRTNELKDLLQERTDVFSTLIK